MHIYSHISDHKENFPLQSDFSVNNNDKEKGFGVYARKSFERGSLVSKFSGTILKDITQHSLQIDAESHIYDPDFAGLLLHSCDPNIVLDMNDFTIRAIKDIREGDALTMDYASTEDYLYRQFKCLCDSDNCRQWITGRREDVNEEGSLLLKQRNNPARISILKAG